MKREELKFKIGLPRSSCKLATSTLEQQLGRITLEKVDREGDIPVSWPCTHVCPGGVPRVGLFGIAALSGWYVSSKAKYMSETDSEQVP